MSVTNATAPKLTELQKAALEYFKNPTGKEIPNNYLNNLQGLKKKGFLKYGKGGSFGYILAEPHQA